MELNTVTPGPAALRALAHPVRLRLLGLLRSDGPSTATLLATRLGLNSGATSYHLRQLAAYGFVLEDTDRGNGRERWWRAAHSATSTRLEGEMTPEEQEAVDAFGQAVALIHAETVQRAVEERPLLPPEWRRTAMLSDWALRLTPARAEQLRQALVDLVTEWSEDTETEGSEEFVVVVETFPRPGRVTGGESR